MDIPVAFAARKREIISALAAPAEEYHDRSPKGSVDAGIQDLIALLNGLDGVVTTSSCAGRVSLFAEGTRHAQPAVALQASSGTSCCSSTATPGLSSGSMSEEAPARTDAAASRRSGGLGGRWLFVTHTPAELDQLAGCIHGLDKPEKRQWSALAAGASDDGPPPQQEDEGSTALIRLQFEPMILHIQTASLAHARPILAAAVTAGWRESGVSSLRCLDDPSTVFPIVAVRSAGLALQSVVGYTSAEPSGQRFTWLVDQRYVAYMTERFRERFAANSERIARFEENLRKTLLLPSPSGVLTTKTPRRAPKKDNKRTDRERVAKGSAPDGRKQHKVEQEEVLDGLELLDF